MMALFSQTAHFRYLQKCIFCFESKATRQHFLFDQLRSLCFSLIIKRKYFFWFSSFFLKKINFHFSSLFGFPLCRFAGTSGAFEITRERLFFLTRSETTRASATECDDDGDEASSTVCLLSINHAGSPGVVAFVCDMMKMFSERKNGKSVFLTAAKVEWIRALNVHH